jgi:hypothetical protein
LQHLDITILYIKVVSQDNSIGIAEGTAEVRFPGADVDFSLPHSVQTGSGVHPASYTMDIRESGWGVNLTTHLHRVPRSRIMEIYNSPICLHGIVLN